MTIGDGLGSTSPVSPARRSVKVKLTYIGEEKTNQKNGKQFREVGAEEFNGEKKSAWDRVSGQFNQFKVGDVVDVLLSDNGKYINGVKAGDAANPTPATGGKAWNKGGYSKAPDPEKDIAVYTRYVLDATINGKMAKEEALELVFAIRTLVKGKL